MELNIYFFIMEQFIWKLSAGNSAFWSSARSALLQLKSRISSWNFANSSSAIWWERCGSHGSIRPLPVMNLEPATTANDEKVMKENFSPSIMLVKSFWQFHKCVNGDRFRFTSAFWRNLEELHRLKEQARQRLGEVQYDQRESRWFQVANITL